MEERPSEMKYIIELQLENMLLKLKKIEDDCLIYSKTASVTASCYFDKAGYSNNETEQTEFRQKSYKCSELSVQYKKIKNNIAELINVLNRMDIK